MVQNMCKCRTFVLVKFLLFLMIGQTFAQSSKMSFFIRPLLETKLDFASSDDFKFSDKVFQFDDRFEYDNIMIKPLKYYFNSGLSLGFKAPKDFKQTSSGSYLVDTDTYIIVVDNLDISTRLKYLFGQIGLTGEMHINKKYWFDFSIL